MDELKLQSAFIQDIQENGNLVAQYREAVLKDATWKRKNVASKI